MKKSLFISNSIETKIFTLEDIDRGIEKIQRRLEEVSKLDSHKTHHDDTSVDAIESKIENTIRDVFGPDSPEFKKHEFHRISYGLEYMGMTDAEFQRNFGAGIPRTKAMLENLIECLEEKRLDLAKTPSISQKSEITDNSIEIISRLCQRFYVVVQQFKRRHQSRSTIEITDEYDVQDLLHGLLRLFFDDIREEEWTPSYAGKSARIDFVIKKEKIVIEVKKTNEHHGAKEIGDELLADIGRYKVHQDCKTLLCFVYDPDGVFKNPCGFESDLNKSHDGIGVKVIISPK